MKRINIHNPQISRRWAAFCVLMATILVTGLASTAAADSGIYNVRFLPLSANEQRAIEDNSGKLHDLPLTFTPYNTRRPKHPMRNAVVGDRMTYLADDPVGQFLIYAIGQPWDQADANMTINIVKADDAAAAPALSHTIESIESPKVALLLSMSDLPAGEYKMQVRIDGSKTPMPEFAFTKSADSRKVMPFPKDGVPLVVHAQNHLPNGTWPITTGLPLPRHTSNDVAEFQLLENGKPVAAQLSRRAHWQPDGSDIKWLGLSFEAKYEDGKPRDYRLIKTADSKPAKPNASIAINETTDAFAIDTGEVSFTVGKTTFAGIENVRLANADTPITTGPGGPFLVDERGIEFTSANDINTSVTIEDQGALTVTIYATGGYTSDRDETSCIYQTRITAYAGRPQIDVTHTTVITYDTDRKQLRELGFKLPIDNAADYAFGGDGNAIKGALPEIENDAKGRPLPAKSVFLHQDRFDHFRVMKSDEQVSEGKRSEGWVGATLAGGSKVQLTLRNIWQMFPKELELSADELNLHVWPRHGHVAFPDEEALDVKHLHKARFAHQGELLNLDMPYRYFTKLNEYNPRVLEQQDINALSANGRGLATTAEFTYHFTSAAKSKDATPALMQQVAALVQDDPHAIADPVYTGLTEVEGRFAGLNEKAFPGPEFVFDVGYRGFVMSVDMLEDYGMWIWPDTHNNWEPTTGKVQLHRWWTNSHYQNVWEATFLYLRSGRPWIEQWATDNSRHFFDVSTVNYHDPDDPQVGKITGSNYHTKGFLPWGHAAMGERCGDDYCEVGAHFINPDVGIIRYLLYGNHRGKRLAEAWAHSFKHVALPPERSREACVTLGEMLSYYELTWDPQALLYINDLADDLFSRPMPEVPAFPGHPLFHDRWVMRYWNLRRDERIKDELLSWFMPGENEQGRKWNYPAVRVMLWKWTGDEAYLTEVLSEIAKAGQGIYNSPDEAMHGFGGKTHFFPTPQWGETIPYYLQALIDAGIELPERSLDDALAIKGERSIPKDKQGDWFNRPDGLLHWQYPLLVGYLHPEGDKPEVTLTFYAFTDTRHGQARSSVSEINLFDANGQALLKTQLVAMSKNAEVTVTIDAAKNPPPWKIYRLGKSSMSWAGDADELTLSSEAKLSK